MTVQDGTVDVQSKILQKGQKWHFDPKMAILALFSSLLHVSYLCKQTIGIIMKGKGKEER
jgi:hypothetical protein